MPTFPHLLILLKHFPGNEGRMNAVLPLDMVENSVIVFDSAQLGLSTTYFAIFVLI
jgi:hypothetical protein